MTPTPKIRALNRWAPPIASALIVATGLGMFVKYEHDRADTVNLIEDCTTPGGKCYQRSQANQAHILFIVSELQTFHSLCIRRPGVARTVEAVDSCVAALAKEHDVDLGH